MEIAPRIGVHPATYAACPTCALHAIRSLVLLWTMRLLNARIDPCWIGLPSTEKAIVTVRLSPVGLLERTCLS